MKKIGVHYDAHADHRDRYIRQHHYYYRLLFKQYRALILPGHNVLEVGCGTGALLATLQPRHGVGIDLSSKMIAKARENHPQLDFFCGEVSTLSLDIQFDYIVLAGTLGEASDIQSLLEDLRRFCTPHTRLVIEHFHPLWQYPLKMMERAGRKIPQPWQNWLSSRDIKNLLTLVGLELVSQSNTLLIPIKIPLISTLANKYLAKLPGFQSLALSRLVVTRHRQPFDKEFSVSIVIPCRNEKDNIENAVNRIPKVGSSQELIFVEGGSQDGTYEEIQRVIAENPGQRISLLRQPGIGKGDAVRSGLNKAQNEILMILDADLTVAPKELPRFYDAILTQKGDFINGSRFIYPMEEGAMRFLNMLGNKFFSGIFSWLLGQPITDTLCGTKVLLRSDYQSIEKNRNYFGNFDPFGDFDLLFGASRLNLKIVDVPIQYRERTYGTTNIHRWRHGWLLLKMTAVAARKLKFI